MAMQKPSPDGVDTSTPNVARMWDYYLGGKNNYTADREAAERVLAMVPEARDSANASREFLTRVVRQLATSGIEQFLDIGSGLPTQGNVHEVAKQANPAARVVYVDYDPVVCAHGRALLEQSERVAVIQADLRQPDEILNSAEARSLINFDEPVAVLLVAILHFVPDEDDPAGVIGKFRNGMIPGSYLALSHATMDALADRDQALKTVKDVYSRSTASIIPRTKDHVLRLFDGFEFIDPGLVWLAEWGAPEPVDHPERSAVYGGVGRKP